MNRLISMAMATTLLTFSASCSDPALEARLAQLEEKVEQMAARPAAPAAAARPPQAQPGGAPDPGEQEAAELLRGASELYEGGDYQGAKGKLAELREKYGATRAARAGARLEADLEVIGGDAPTLTTEKWFQGDTSFDEGDATLVVFWEVWCPHCKREVPKLEATYAKYKDQGLNMIGLTKMSRDITEDQVTEFISSNNITYPIGKEEGQSMSDAFNVRGVPAAAVVKNGKIVWKGHPARLTDNLIEGWL